MELIRKRILIVEDDSIQSEYLKRTVLDYNANYLVECAHDYENALMLAESTKYDLIFMDIDLGNPLMNGYDLAKSMRNQKHHRLTWIVFLTVRKEYERMAFKQVHCYDYLLKPLIIVEVYKCLEILLEDEATPSERKSIVVELDHVAVKVYMDEIVFVEVKGRDLMIYTINGPMNFPYYPLKRIERELLSYNWFYKTHRSFIVNMRYIKSIERLSTRQYSAEMKYTELRVPIMHHIKEILVEKLGNGW